MKQIEYLTDEDKAALAKVMVKRFKEYSPATTFEYFEPGDVQYTVTLGDEKFTSIVDDNELNKSAEYAVEIMELLKKMCNEGVTLEKLQAIYEKEMKALDSIAAPNTFSNPDMHAEDLRKLVNEIATFRRVGGAYWMIISCPPFYALIGNVLFNMFDKFEDTNYYANGAFLIFKGILKIHSDQVTEPASPSKE